MKTVNWRRVSRIGVFCVMTLLTGWLYTWYFLPMQYRMRIQETQLASLHTQNTRLLQHNADLQQEMVWLANAYSKTLFTVERLSLQREIVQGAKDAQLAGD